MLWRDASGEEPLVVAVQERENMDREWAAVWSTSAHCESGFGPLFYQRGIVVCNSIPLRAGMVAILLPLVYTAMHYKHREFQRREM
jgi:hypothetical protein